MPKAMKCTKSVGARVQQMLAAARDPAASAPAMKTEKAMKAAAPAPPMKAMKAMKASKASFWLFVWKTFQTF